jgi:hypothetical protein
MDQMTRLYLANAVDSIGGVNREMRWGYNQRGQLLAETTYTGSTARPTSYVYDRLGRDSPMTDVNGVLRTRYDPTIGLPIRIVTPYSDSLAYSYDGELRLTGPTIMSSGPQQTVTPTWTGVGELEKLEHIVSTSPTTFTPLTYNKGEIDEEPSLPSILPHWLEQHGMGAAKDTLRDSVNYDGWERVTAVVSFRAGTVVSRDTFAFDRVGNISVDQAVLERSDLVAVMPAQFRWDDVGTWDAVGRTRAQDAGGNVAVGNVEMVDTTNTIVWSEDGAIVTFGVDDLVIVRTEDVTFVTHRDRTSELKQMLDQLSPGLRERKKRNG